MKKLLLIIGLLVPVFLIFKKRKASITLPTPIEPPIPTEPGITRFDWDRTRVLALIPAHNEEDEIATTINHTINQVDWVVVVADNCTDNTEAIARSMGVEVFKTVDNEHKKAGGLNQAMAKYLPGLQEHDQVLVVDADSHIAPDFIKNAQDYIENQELDAVGGVFQGRDGGGFCGWSQRNEYARYARDVERIRGKTLCLTGTATLFTVSSLRSVIRSRVSETVYDTSVITEDFELTLRLKHLSYKILAPVDCSLTTEVMETWGDLHRQRLRWKRGAIQSLWRYRVTKHTIGQWGRQLLTFMGLLVTTIYFSSIAYCVITWDFQVAPIWLAVTGIFMLERAITVRKRGLKHAFGAMLLLPEMVFDTIIQATHVKALFMQTFRMRTSW